MPLDPKSRTYRDTFKSQGILLPQVQRHVMKKSLLPDEDRRLDILHPSEIAKANWCPRHDYYRIIGQYPANATEMNSFRSESIFDYGHSVHRKWQGWFWEMGILWGRWLCLNAECKNKWYDTSPSECPLCHHDVIKYIEIPIISDEYLVHGHADGAFEKKVIEIKSVGIGTVRFDAPLLHQDFVNEQLTTDELWFRINRPFKSHIRQAMLYLHFMREMYGDEWDTIVFIYEWKANQDAKEFVIKYNRSLIEKSLEGMASVVRAKAEGKPPRRPDWAEPDHKTCSKCPVKGQCFGSANRTASAPSLKIKKAPAAQRRRALSR